MALTPKSLGARRLWRVGQQEPGGRLKLPSLRLPERLPDLRRPWLTLFEIFWFAALLLAIAGPIAGLYYRFTTPGENSALMLGSRTGLVLSEDDLTYVRFPIGAAAKAAGVRPGDHIVAIDGIPLSKVVPLSPSETRQGTDTDYALFGPVHPKQRAGRARPHVALAQGAKCATSRSVTSEEPIEQAARAVGLTPTLLGVVDLLHIVTYPFLLFAAWILHRRKRDDLISSVLSLAILLTIASEQPSAAFLELHCPRSRMDPPAPLRPRQYVPARRNPAVPVRPVETARVGTVPGRVADPLLPVGRRLPGNLRNIHDRRRADAHVAAQEHPAERGQTANQMGAARFLRLRLLPRARFPQRHDQAE